MRIETIAVHAGHAPDPATGAVTPPIHLSTTFEREADDPAYFLENSIPGYAFGINALLYAMSH